MRLVSDREVAMMEEGGMECLCSMSERILAPRPPVTPVRRKGVAILEV